MEHPGTSSRGDLGQGKGTEPGTGMGLGDTVWQELRPPDLTCREGPRYDTVVFFSSRLSVICQSLHCLNTARSQSACTGSKPDVSLPANRGRQSRRVGSGHPAHLPPAREHLLISSRTLFQNIIWLMMPKTSGPHASSGLLSSSVVCSQPSPPASWPPHQLCCHMASGTRAWPSHPIPTLPSFSPLLGEPIIAAPQLGFVPSLIP